MVEPATFITIGGVRYHKDSIINHSETIDNNGTTTYNVTLEGGTKISYPKQGKSGEGYTVDFFRRGNKNPKIKTSKVRHVGSQQPLVLADKPMNNNCDVSISIFGLKNATIQGNPNINEDLFLTNCRSNTIYLNDGNNIEGNDIIFLADDDVNAHPNKNNTVYLDEFDFHDYFGDNPTHGNKIIRDNE